MSLEKKNARKNFNGICKKRDHYRCLMCRTQIGDITVHHIMDRHLFKNGGYVKENGITLCDACHLKAEWYHQSEGKRWHLGYHPANLFEKIGSSYLAAIEADEENE